MRPETHNLQSDQWKCGFRLMKRRVHFKNKSAPAPRLRYPTRLQDVNTFYKSLLACSQPLSCRITTTHPLSGEVPNAALTTLGIASCELPALLPHHVSSSAVKAPYSCSYLHVTVPFAFKFSGQLLETPQMSYGETLPNLQQISSQSMWLFQCACECRGQCGPSDLSD